MKTIAISVLFVLTLGCSTPEKAASEGADYMSFNVSGDSTTDQGLARWKSAVERNPNDVGALNSLGEGLLQKGRETGEIIWYARSKTALEAAETIDKNDTRTLSNLAWISTVYHDFQSAKAYAKRSIDIQPENAAAYGILTDAHLELGEYEEAEATCQKMVDLHPSLASYSRAAQVRFVYGNTQGAIEMYKRAITAGAAFPENVNWCRVMLGDIYFKSGALRPAEEVYKAVLKGDSVHRLALAGMGRLAVTKNDLGSAVDYFEKATQGAAPPSFLYEMGELYEAAEKDDESKAAFARFADRLREYRAAGIGGDEVMWITYWLDRGIETEKALELAQSEAEHHKNVPTFTVLAWSYAANGKPQDALNAAKQALRTNIQDPGTYYRLAKVYEACGDRSKARQLANAALTLNPRFHVAHAEDARRILRSANNRATR